MLTPSLPGNLKVKLDRLRLDPEFQALLKALGEPHLPRYKPSPSAKAGKGEDYSAQQKDNWIYASGTANGWRLLKLQLGPAGPKEEGD